MRARDRKGPLRFSFQATILLVLGAGLSSMAWPEMAERKGPRWHTDFPDARAEARLTGKPIFAVLH